MVHFRGFPGGGRETEKKGSISSVISYWSGFGNFWKVLGFFGVLGGNCHQKREKHLHCAQLICLFFVVSLRNAKVAGRNQEASF